MERYKSRKFLLSVGIIILASIFLGLEKLGGTEWISAVTISAGIYAGGNVAKEKVKKGR